MEIYKFRIFKNYVPTRNVKKKKNDCKKCCYIMKSDLTSKIPNK